jgi:hypothetical protein
VDGDCRVVEWLPRVTRSRVPGLPALVVLVPQFTGRGTTERTTLPIR